MFGSSQPKYMFHFLSWISISVELITDRTLQLSPSAVQSILLESKLGWRELEIWGPLRFYSVQNLGQNQWPLALLIKPHGQNTSSRFLSFRPIVPCYAWIKETQRKLQKSVWCVLTISHYPDIEAEIFLHESESHLARLTLVIRICKWWSLLFNNYRSICFEKCLLCYFICRNLEVIVH